MATTWAWPRLSGRGSLRWAGRVLAVLGCQVAAVLAMAVYVNDFFDFYGSWDDLVGTQSSVPVTIVQDTPVTVAGVGASAQRVVRIVKSRLVVDRRYATPATRPGRVQTVQVPGAVTGISQQAYVYLPPQYDRAGAAPMPVTLVLAGYPGHIGTLVRNLDTIGQMDDLIRAGRVTPMVLVLMSPTVAEPRDTECADVVGGPRVETYFSTDVPTWIEAHFHVDPPGTHWGVLGVSTGGFCAVKLAMRHPQVFGSAVGMSGYLHTLEDVTTGDLYGGSTALRATNDPLWRLQHLPPPAVGLLLTVGRTETEVYPDVQHFAALARPPLTVATVIVPSSGHNFTVWKRLLPTCLQWLSSRIA